jgi:ABC-type siderophore export system fused ATPase/permease subunit
MSNQLQNNIRNGLNDHLAQFEASRERLRAIHNDERESRAKARKRRAMLQTVSDLIESVFIALGIFLSVAIVVTVLIFAAFGFTAPDGFGIQLPSCGYFWESIQ